jgi:hypothetical protein
LNVIASSHRRFERRFYLGASLVFFALVFWTFARPYYLKMFVHTPPLSRLVHIHGVVMTGWVVLLVVQTSLIVGHRVQWHRRLGVCGAVWAAFVVILGSATTLHAAVNAVRRHTDFAAIQVAITGLELVQMVLFAVIVGTAIWLRRRSDYHKRLMLLTIACLLPSALARLPVSFMSNWVILLSLDLFVLACVTLDTLRHRRLHPAFGWGAAAVLLTLHLTFYVVMTPWWVSRGTALVS